MFAGEAKGLTRVEGGKQSQRGLSWGDMELAGEAVVVVELDVEPRGRLLEAANGEEPKRGLAVGVGEAMHPKENPEVAGAVEVAVVVKEGDPNPELVKELGGAVELDPKPPP